MKIKKGYGEYRKEGFTGILSKNVDDDVIYII